MAERLGAEVRYTAFLSYSHKDAAAAGRLHRRLEAYRLPRRLVGAETARGPVPDRLWPIFRDREELPAATDLSETVREALARSGALIVLCSPHAAGSLWVAEEIGTFRRLHPDRPILAAVLDGDPPDCFPAKLRAFGQDGTWHEPLATDLRRGRDGAHLGLLKLVAGITGVGLDALVQRDAQRKIRRVTGVTFVALAAMLIMAALALVALDARREAERQRAEAEGQVEFMLTDLREKLRGVGRLDIMTAVNERALRYYGGQGDVRDLPDDSLERRARVLHAMGEDDLARGRRAAAVAAFAEAHRTTGALLGRSNSNPNRIFAHAQSEFWLGRIEYEGFNYPAARRQFERYKALADQLVASDRRNPDWLKEAGYAEGSLCTTALGEGSDPAAALRTCTAALRRMEQVRQLLGNDTAILADLANRHAWVADAWRLRGRLDRAIYHRRRQERLATTLISREPRNVDYREIWMRTQYAYGELLRARGDVAQARARYSEASATARRLRALDANNETWRGFEVRIAQAAAGIPPIQ